MPIWLHVLTIVYTTIHSLDLLTMLSLKVMYHAITNFSSIRHVLVYYVVMGLNAGIFIAAFRPGDMQAGIRLFTLICWRWQAIQWRSSGPETHSSS